MIWKKLFGAREPVEPSADDECDALLDAALDWLDTTTSDMRAGPLQSIERFDLDLAAGRITFTDLSGRAKNFSCQAVGTFNEAKETWHWAWDHPSIPSEVATCAERVREFGKRFELDAFVTRQIEANEQDAWQFSALAGMLTDAMGVYRCPSGDLSVFVTLLPVP
jgi:hypothetical protein